MAIKAALVKAGIEADQVEGVILGHVLQGGCGQAPARQASLFADVPKKVDVMSVNKVCASGLKSVSLAAQSIALGHSDVMVAGGMESMSNAPYLIRKVRGAGFKYGHEKLDDMLLLDGLWDVYNNIHMGMCAEKTAKDLSISRGEQDEFAIESYKRAADAWSSGVMEREVTPVKIPTGKKGDSPFVTVERDEEYSKLKLDKVASLKPAFDKEGTVTAANASKMNDGAAAVVLMSAEKAREHGVRPLARIISFADAAIDPIDFPIAPVQAVKNALKYADLHSVDFHEINEAFSAVTLANMKLGGVDHSRVNVHGGAVALGHPIGASGCRILVSLLNILDSRGGLTGCASICNGGGGATALVVERCT